MTTEISFPTIPSAVVTQVYNNYNPSYYGGDGRHKGIDYGIMVKSQIYSCMAGMVKTADVSENGYGRHLRIMHEDGSVAIYGHLAEFRVNVGDVVQSGHLIALSGGDPTDTINGDGSSTGPHLHWEIRPPGKTDSDKYAVDPERYCLAKIESNCKTATVNASDGLRVRTSPVGGQVISMLKNGEQVKVQEVVDGWAKLCSLRDEWCSASYLTMLEAIDLTDPMTIDKEAEIRDIIELFGAALVRLENLL